MGAVLAEILSIASTVLTDAPQVVSIVEEAIAAFKANDQASLDAANAKARALADSLKPQDA
jgi:hypothetical protein